MVSPMAACIYTVVQIDTQSWPWYCEGRIATAAKRYITTSGTRTRSKVAPVQRTSQRPNHMHTRTQPLLFRALPNILNGAVAARMQLRHGLIRLLRREARVDALRAARKLVS